MVKAVANLATLAILARHFDLETFGDYCFVFALCNVFQAMTGMGMNKIIVREIAKKPQAAGEIFDASFFIRILFGFITFVILALSILTILGGALAVIGFFITLFSWFPLAFPEILEIIRINFMNTRIVDPSSAFMLFFATGLTLLAISLIILGFDFYFLKAAQIIDQDMANYVDRHIPSIKILSSTKSKAVFILAILLFGTFIVFLTLLL